MASGRTTGVRTLFAAEDPDKQATFKSVCSPDSLQAFQSDPSNMSSEIALDSADGTCHYAVQVTFLQFHAVSISDPGLSSCHGATRQMLPLSAKLSVASFED